ncbi:hypothetical protein JCM15060_12680 [Halanaerobaculum tunisiense]
MVTQYINIIQLFTKINNYFTDTNKVGPASQLGPLIKLHERFSRIQLSVIGAPYQRVSQRLYVTIDVYFTLDYSTSVSSESSPSSLKNLFDKR